MKIVRNGVCLSALPGVLILVSLASHLFVSHRQQLAEEKIEQARSRIEFTPEEIREDLLHFQDLLERVHPPEIPGFPLVEMEDELLDLRESVNNPLTRVEFYRRLAPIAHGLGDEHVMVHPPEPGWESPPENGRHLFPLEVRFLGDRLFIARNLPGLAGPQAGSEILSINGLPAKELRETLLGCYPGTSYAQRQFYLQNRFGEALFWVYGFNASFDLVVRKAASEATTRHTLDGRPLHRPGPEAFRREVIAPRIMLFTWNAFEDETHGFARFLVDMFRSARERRIQHLIIDLRQNQGGTTSLGDDLLAYLSGEPFSQMPRSEITVSEEVRAEFLSYVPGFLRWFPIHYLHPLLRPLWTVEEGETASVSFEPVLPRENPLRFAGRVHLLIGPGTMSSASLFAATVQAFELGSLYGEETGGFATHYGNVVDVFLPNTGMEVWMPTSVNYGNGEGPIVPDHLVAQTEADLTQGRDTVLEYVLDIIDTGR